MRHTALKLKMLASVTLTLGLASAVWAVSLPVSESFEGYANGYSIVNETDWSGATDAGIVTNNAAAIAALATYTSGGGAFPLPNATHTNVLQISDSLTNSVLSATGGVVLSEMLFMPAQRAAAPAGSTNYQFACYVDTNDKLVVWHRGATSNEWLTLTGGPSLETGVWTRVAIRKAYATHRYQIMINEAAPIEDAGGWSLPGGGGHPGSWFDMVQTNGYMQRFRTEGTATAYLDDLVFTNRSVNYSGTSFAEAAANDGSITATRTITLAGDTFVNTSYDEGTHFSTSAVPAGLSVALAYVSPTQVSVSLTGTASAHAADDSIGGIGVTLEDSIFTLGNAADVTGYARGDLSVSFDNPPVLSYDTTTFMEDTGGVIGNNVAITLEGDTLTGGARTLVLNTDYTLSGTVPSGLTFALTSDGDTNLTATLSGMASPNEPANSTNLVLTLKDAAFSTVAASNITGYSASLDVTFIGSPVLTYSTNVFSEAAANDGTIDNDITITLSGDGLAKSGNLVQDTDYTLSDSLPNGLSFTLNSDDDKTLTATLSGTASPHADSNGKTITLTLDDGVFDSGTASQIAGYTTNLVIDLDDPPVLSYSGTAFAEASANNGTIGNALTGTLVGDTLTGAARTLVLSTDYTITSGAVPDGLSLRIESDGDDTLTFNLDNSASPHTSDENGSFEVSFSNALFTTVAASNITASIQSFSVTLDDQPSLSYSRTTFEELSLGTIDNITVLTITLTAAGDSFAVGAFAEGTHFDIEGLPDDLTAVLDRTSGSTVEMTLTGTAAAHADANDTTFTNTFKNAAFGVTDADQVTNYKQVFTLNFNDSTLVINPVPYQESFETQADGYAMGNGDGWDPEGTGTVTSETAIVTALDAWGSEFPLVTNHTQVLRMTDEITDEIKSGSGGTVYSDMMFYVTGRESAPAGSADYQFAMFADANQELNVWHRDTSDTPTNTWATLAGVTVTTGAWHRVTVQADYAEGKYQLYLDGSTTPIANPTSGDSWFNMVGIANTYMSRLRVLGGSADDPTYLDDIRVAPTKPEFLVLRSSMFMFR